MTDNSQNTYTGGGGAVAAPSGNGILDAFTSLANVAVSTVGNLYGAYDTVRERDLAYQIQKDNATKLANQSLPAATLNAALGYIGQPGVIQRGLFYTGVVAMLAVGTIWLVRKAH